MAKTINNSILAFLFVSACFAVGCASKEPFRLDSFLSNRQKAASVENALAASLKDANPGNSKQNANSTFAMKRSPSDYFVNSKTTHQQKAIREAKEFAGQKPSTKERLQSAANSMHEHFAAAGNLSSRLDGQFIEQDDPTSLTSDPGELSAALYMSSAVLHEKSGQIDKAVAQYEKLLNGYPTHRSGLIGLARLHHRSNQIVKSLDVYRRAMVAYPNDPIILNDYGLTLAKNGNLGESIATLEAAIELKPNANIYRNNLAAVYVQDQRPEDALAVLTTTYGPAIGNYNVGYLMKQQGDLTGAKPYLTAALAENPDLGEARALLLQIDPNMEQGRDRVALLPKRASSGASASDFYEVHQTKSSDAPTARILPTHKTRLEPTSGSDQMHRVPSLDSSAHSNNPNQDVTVAEYTSLQYDGSEAADIDDLGIEEPESLPPIVLSSRMPLGINDDTIIDQGVKQASAELQIPVVEFEVDAEKIEPPTPPQL